MNGVVERMNGEFNIPFTNFLSYNEQQFLKEMRKGIDNLIQHTRVWLSSSEANYLLNLSKDDFMDEFHNSQFYLDILEIMKNNALICLPFLKRFYEDGVSIGYDELDRPVMYNEYDARAFNILQVHVAKLVYDVNVEMANGIKDTLYESANEKRNKYDIIHALVLLPFVPLVSNISVDTRCKVITYTEYARAVNTGTLQTFAKYGINRVDIVTRGDDVVCDTCLLYESNNPYTLSEICDILPVHPNCRCGVSPVIDGIIGEEYEPLIIDLTHNNTNEQAVV